MEHLLFDSVFHFFNGGALGLRDIGLKDEVHESDELVDQVHVLDEIMQMVIHPPANLSI